ncbi:MAG: hypothetical protein J6V28_04970 [Tidjanibacter sp.]|nr:hypothetical protein [Tidjanibacter sp.]
MVSYEDFELFLREQECEEAFHRAFRAHNDATNMDPQLWEASADAATFLGRAFRWSETPEGRDFWQQIDLLWHRRCIGL